jgi:hypothetical protein
MRANWKLAAMAPLAGLLLAAGCAAASGTDEGAVDKHTHANSVASNDSDYNALPRRPGSAGFEDKLFQRFLADLHLARIPPTLDAFFATVVTPKCSRRRSCLLPGGEVRGGVPQKPGLSQ